jgi:tetratricopeptide (TPR) repeat protein
MLPQCGNHRSDHRGLLPKGFWGGMEKTDYFKSAAQDCFESGRRLARDGRHQEAIEAFNLAIAKIPAYAEAYFVRGACYYALGSYHQAADDIDAAAILGCRDAQFWSKHATQPVLKGL